MLERLHDRGGIGAQRIRDRERGGGLAVDRGKHDRVAPCDVHAAAVASSAEVSMPDSRSSACVPTITWWPSILARTPRPASAMKVVDRVAAGRQPAHARRWPSRADAPIAAPRPPPGGGSSRDRRRRAYRPRPACLPSACRSCRRPRYRPPASRSRGSPPLMSTPALAPRPLATMTAVGTARPMAHGQAMIRTATAAVNAEATDGSAGTTIHRREGGNRDRDDDRDEEGRDAIGEPLNRRLRSLRLLHQRDDAGQHARRAEAGRLDFERARPC